MNYVASLYRELTVIDYFGVFSIILTVIAISLGAVSLRKRKRAINVASSLALLSIACAGMAATGFRIFRSSYPRLPPRQYDLDPLQWFYSYGFSWLPATLVLSGCSIGFAMVALSCFLTQDTSASGKISTE